MAHATDARDQVTCCCCARGTWQTQKWSPFQHTFVNIFAIDPLASRAVLKCRVFVEKHTCSCESASSSVQVVRSGRVQWAGSGGQITQWTLLLQHSPAWPAPALWPRRWLLDHVYKVGHALEAVLHWAVIHEVLPRGTQQVLVQAVRQHDDMPPMMPLKQLCLVAHLSQCLGI